MPIPRGVNRCSGCGYIVPGAWTECRKCGTPLAAVPVAAVPVAVPAVPVAVPAWPAAVPAAPIERPRSVVPDTMPASIEPVIVHAPAKAGASLNAKAIAIAVVAVAIVAAGVSSVVPHGSPAKALPTILAPQSPSAGIPTSLSAIVRIAAESARHTALATVIDTAGSTGAPLSTEQLKQAQPSYQWIAGNEPSTTNTVVSITSSTGIDVIAVSGTDRDICAFGRWSPTVGSDYVTMAHVDNCSAANAPTTGWASEPGGSAQDLPGSDGT